MTALDRLAAASARAAAPGALLAVSGAVADVTPTTYRVRGLSPFSALGDCVVLAADGRRHGEIVRVDPDCVTVKPFATTSDVRLGAVVTLAPPVTIAPAVSWKGRIVDAFGAPIDEAGALEVGPTRRPIQAEPPPALERGRVKEPLKSGVRIVDIFTPLCHGQRIGIFAGSGVGKSTLLGMMAASKGFDTVVIALVGERGREVREFIEDALGANRAVAVTVVATGDESPMMRQMAPLTAMAIAEFFRDRGERVLLMVDSVTRYAHAARDVALAAGEPAVARGYAPSVFTSLPKLLERAGPGLEGRGSITGIFAVLVDGDDHNDPVADCIRGTLDGHIVLDRAIADAYRYPAIDVTRSISRLAQHVWTPDQRTLVGRLRQMVSRFEDTRDLRLMGGLQAGADPDLDQAVALTPIIYEALCQAPHVAASTDAFRELAEALNRTRQ
ncbi:Flagellum-specific ATP synthase [Beijerinckiaceae bacterium RH CH11]|nr:Flagellum-specific ATP synthase [Beijerinckiaceae bacterium RH CH11]VVB48580.1 Flagellum-specific ATP synthase [Beijerinckiaceae bacterium RH AL8]